MESENQEVIYCADYLCDKLCIESFHKNHLKSGNHMNNTTERQQ